MKIVIDLDGTICSLKKEGQTYSDVLPNYKAIEKIKLLKEKGHYIILQTARHMETCGSNVGLINAKIGKITYDWLEKYSVPYDEVFFGKPNGFVYLDDNAKTFTSWDDIEDLESYSPNKINIIIPMAGAGSRFAEAGYDLPKPLIDVKGKPMFYWATSSFEFLQKNYEVQLIFVVLKEHTEKYNIDVEIKKYYPNAIIIELDKITRGQAETVFMTKNYINNYNKLIIFNSDTYTIFDENDFPIDDEKIEGLISCFESNDAKYSYAKLDEWGYVEEVAEKIVISNNATNGMYYFKKGCDFVNYAGKMIEKKELSSGEFYVGPMYNDLINAGKRIKINGVKENWILGTPEELEYFLKNYK